MQALSKQFQVKRANLSDTVYVLRCDKLKAALNLYAYADVCAFFEKNKSHLMVMRYEEHTMLFTYLMREGDVCEFHIACPEQSRHKSQLMTYSALKWIYLHSTERVKHFYTFAPKGKVANFVRKYAAQEVAVTGDTVHFMATVEQLLLNQETTHGIRRLI